VPTDPEFVIPIAVWTLSAFTTPVWTSTSTVIIQVTGIKANSLGFYPTSLVTIRFGSRATSCRPNPFGECLVAVSNPSPGPAAISVTYTGYGVSYRSPSTLTQIATLSLPPANVATSQPLSVSIHHGIARSIMRVTIGSVVAQTQLGANGDGVVQFHAPGVAGTFRLSVTDAAVALAQPTLNVHA
jgi:hypothetical protein